MASQAQTIRRIIELRDLSDQLSELFPSPAPDSLAIPFRANWAKRLINIHLYFKQLQSDMCF